MENEILYPKFPHLRTYMTISVDVDFFPFDEIHCLVEVGVGIFVDSQMECCVFPTFPNRGTLALFSFAA
jgi:hypothetical protein